jgi:hypothetical protein
MRVKSFTIVAIRLIGLLSIAYGLMTFIFILFTMFMLSDVMGRAGMGSAISMQFILPVLMIVLGVVLLVASRSLGGTLSRGLED